MISRSHFLAQRKDVEEFWMYTLDPNRAVDARHYMANYGSKRMWTCYRWLIQYMLQIEPHGHGTWQNATGLQIKRLVYTKQTVYDTLQILGQSRCI